MAAATGLCLSFGYVITSMSDGAKKKGDLLIQITLFYQFS